MSNTNQFKNYSLSGEWKLTWLDTGKGRIEERDRLFKENQVISCMVPGDVHIALTDAGIIQDPLMDKNSTACKWVEEKEFWGCIRCITLFRWPRRHDRRRFH